MRERIDPVNYGARILKNYAAAAVWKWVTSMLIFEQPLGAKQKLLYSESAKFSVRHGLTLAPRHCSFRGIKKGGKA